MQTIMYRTAGTCARRITVELDDDARILSVAFDGGCSGNLQGIARLVTGLTADEVIDKLSGVRCGMKQTSCPDQLAQALRRTKEGDAGE